MHVVTLAWMYVAVMMAVAEAASPQGTLLGAAITFTLYGLLPLGLVLYVMGTPARKRARAAQEAQEAAASSQPDAGHHATTDSTIPPVGEEPPRVAHGAPAGAAVVAQDVGNAQSGEPGPGQTR